MQPHEPLRREAAPATSPSTPHPLALARPLAAVVVAAAAAAALWWWSDGAPPDGPRGPAPHTAPPRSTPGDGTPAPATPAPAQRPEPPMERFSAELAASGEPELDFAEAVRRMCELGLRVSEEARNDEMEAATRYDNEARAVLDDVLVHFDDAGERALDMLMARAEGPPPEQREPLEVAHLAVLRMVLDAEFQRRHDAAAKLGERAHLDGLVQALLDSMPVGRVLHEAGEATLAGRPFLHTPHEPTVLQLLDLAKRGGFPRRVATSLLTTLWDNLLASGARTEAELNRLSLVLLDADDPGKVIAACRQLLRDPRYVRIATAWLRERGDRELAAEVARTAACELPPDQAMLVLRELGPLTSHVRGLYLGVAVRAPDVVADAYRLHLAADDQPELRRELLMGAAMVPSPTGAELAELALANDPSPDVRIQAIFALTTQSDTRRAEHAMQELLDDPTIAQAPMHLGALVLALENLEHGDPNSLQRVGSRLATLALSGPDRERLETMLGRALPGGGAPSGGAGDPGSGAAGSGAARSGATGSGESGSEAAGR